MICGVLSWPPPSNTLLSDVQQGLVGDNIHHLSWEAAKIGPGGVAATEW